VTVNSCHTLFCTRVHLKTEYTVELSGTFFGTGVVRLLQSCFLTLGAEGRGLLLELVLVLAQVRSS